ncbi:CRISPR-associated helicase Cas3' [Peptoniphilus sp.]|uniref:CRISPR-associated helicase Cas3' n=1 Tax=Peptoniphilus sp. TaxID=1971214 RepID=UPI003D903DF6
MELNKFWAKKSSDHGVLKWLPLEQHLLDTRFVMKMLYNQWLDDGQRNLIESSLSGGNTNPVDLVEFIATVHDLGKCIPAFSARKSFNESAKDLDEIVIGKIVNTGFSELSDYTDENAKFTKHALGSEALLNYFGVNEDIASIVGAHHGKPVDISSTVNENISTYPSNYFVKDNSENLKEKWMNIYKEVLDWALEINNYESVKDLPNIKQNVQVLLAGLLIMADWIASNENYFPLISIYDGAVEDKSSRYRDGWNAWRKSNNWTPSLNLNVDTLFSERFDFINKPREAQYNFAKIIDECTSPGIFIFEAPMGLGKTEAALVGAEIMASKLGKNGLYFGLPTQATSNGIFPRLYDWLGKVADENGENLQIRLAHGKAALNDKFESLARNIDIDGGTNVYVNEWFGGRKTTALDDFVVGTVDQLLLMGLKQKHLMLRHLGFSKKVVIIDEVHAYDIFSSQFLFTAIKWLAAYNVPVIILSATLPYKKREELIHSYTLGKGLKFGKVKKENVDFKTDSYPLVTYTDGEEIKQFQEFQKEDGKDVKIVLEESENLENLVSDLSQDKGIIGIVVNTVKKAQEISKSLAEKFGDENIFLLHSRFIDTGRAKKEEELLNLIGKEGQRPKFKIIIGTQVIEQSLDIDFDVLISDLAPIDLLIQRIGRLHRHKRENRPEKLKMPTLYVLGTSDKLEFEKGSSSVYGEYLLARTQYFLPDKINLPNDISPLVQKVYAENEIDFGSDTLNEKYYGFKKSYDALQNEKEEKTHAYMLQNPKHLISKFRSNSLIGWLSTSQIEDNLKSEVKVAAQVRDIEETIEVIAVKKIGDGYGFFDGCEDISGEIDMANISKELAKNTLRLPQSLSKPYIIDKTIKELEEYNLKHLRSWQDENWLKGSLGIIFDENGEFILNGFKLHYDNKYGLLCERL